MLGPRARRAAAKLTAAHRKVRTAHAKLARAQAALPHGAPHHAAPHHVRGVDPSWPPWMQALGRAVEAAQAELAAAQEEAAQAQDQYDQAVAADAAQAAASAQAAPSPPPPGGGGGGGGDDGGTTPDAGPPMLLDDGSGYVTEVPDDDGDVAGYASPSGAFAPVRHVALIGDLFGDIAHGFQDVAKVVAPVLKPIKDLYDKIPTPVKALLAPQTLITEYAYQHPEMIPVFGKQASQAKALFEGLKSGKLDAQSAASIAAQAVGSQLHLPPQAANAIASAAHVAAAASPLASQALQIAHAAQAATHPAQVPHARALRKAPPAPAPRQVHLTLASHAAAGAPPPPVVLPLAAYDNPGRRGFNASFEVHV